MGWSVGRFESWFLEYHRSDGVRATRSTAVRRHISELADDLHQNWYLSIRSTVDAMSRDGRDLPAWLDDESAATRYALRALDNDAIDLVRQQGRAPIPASAYSDGTGSPLDDALPISDDVVGSGRLEWDEVLNAIRRTLSTMLTNGQGGCPGCTALMTVRLSLAVVELLGPGMGHDEDPGVSGGTDEWDRALYAALERVAPERVTKVDGRMDPRTRQLKKRCGDCTRRLLERIAGGGLGDGSQHGAGA